MRCDSRFSLSTLNLDISIFWIDFFVAIKIDSCFSDLLKFFWTKHSWISGYHSPNSISGFTVIYGELTHTSTYQTGRSYCSMTIKGTYRYPQRQKGRKHYLMFQGFFWSFFPTNWVTQTYKNLNFQINLEKIRKYGSVYHKELENGKKNRRSPKPWSLVNVEISQCFCYFLFCHINHTNYSPAGQGKA